MSLRTRWPQALDRPEQGWSSLFLLLGMLLLLGISVADARPLSVATEQGSLSQNLPVLLVAAGLIGFLLARSHMGVVRAHLIGATVAALLLLWGAGELLLRAAPDLAPDGALSERVGAVWVQLGQDVRASVEGEPSTPVVTFLLLGSILWSAAQFGAFSIFRYDRGGPAVLTVGTILCLNIGLGSSVPQDQLLPVLPVLATFAILAMGLLIRMQLVQQRLQWARRHITDAGDVSRLFLRSGAVFVALTVAGASSLTVLATAEPVSVRLDALEEPLEDLGDEIARWLGLIGVPPPAARPSPRGNSSAIRDSWEPGTGTAFTAAVEGPWRANYWWGWADDLYDPEASEWRTQRGSEEAVSAGEALPPTVASGNHRVSVSMSVGDAWPPTARAQLFRLSEATVVDRDVRTRVVDDGADFTDVTWARPLEEGDEVRVTSFVHDYRRGGEGLTASQLRAAGQRYPDWVRQRYLQGAGDERISGEGMRALVAEIMAQETTPYDRALALQSRFIGGDYAYVISLDCSGYLSIPECVLAERQGFCTHYATTMTMALREMGIPARFVTGYLPGELDRQSGLWTVAQAALHNWVEVYFPRFGWIRFDPTPGRAYNQAPTRLPEGQAGPPRESPTPEPVFEPDPVDEITPPATPEPLALTGDSGEGGDPLFRVIGLGAVVAILLSLVGTLLLYRLRRLPDGDDGLAYRGIVAFATRLGYGPHPSQTEYEYAGTLAQAMPSVRGELYVVADAQVETTYGQRHLDDQRRGLLRRAYSRIRTALLRLSLRRR